jgi:uncharacterized protein (DUF1697 family)
MKMVALLRGINVGGNRKVPMPELCAAAIEAGLTEVKSYIQSGNLVFHAGKLNVNQATLLLEKAIEDRFGFPVDVMVRTAVQWKKYASGSPFPGAARARPNLLHLGLSKFPCNKNIAEALKEVAVSGEKIKLVGDAIWIDFAAGVGKSKLTPAALDKAAGSAVTMRNWNTVSKINEMLVLGRVGGSGANPNFLIKAGTKSARRK